MVKVRLVGAAVAALVAACGGTSSSGKTNGHVSDAGPGGSGGSEADSGAGGVATGGEGGAAGATGGRGGAGGVGGMGGTSGCSGLDYCGCAARSDCTVLAEACFCPCGETCQPSCACVCGGGAFLGCTAASITAPGQLDGIWLVGWSGGLNHYSWVRFSGNGVADFLDGSAIGTNAPYWPCNGRGSWLFSQKPETVYLTMPAGCSVSADVVTFTGFKAPAGFPKAAMLGASLDGMSTGTPLEGWKFPASQCDAAFTTCQDPFGFPP